MYLRRTVGPVAAPATAAEVMALGRITDTADTALVTRKIAQATAIVSEMTGRVVMAETWAYSVPAIVRNDLVLPKSPVQSVESITYLDAEDVQQDATVSDFYLMKDEDRAVLRPKSGTAWPTANTDRDDAITITFVAGYTTVPDSIKQAVEMLALHLFENPDVVLSGPASEMPMGLRAMIDVDRIGWVAG